MNSAIALKIKAKRRVVRVSIKPFIAKLGKPDGTLYCDEPGKYWISWRGSKAADGTMTYGQVSKVWAGDTNYLPAAGRQVYIGPGLNGALTIRGAVPEDLVNGGFDSRTHNPNDPDRSFVYTPNIVTFRSDALADEGNDTLKVNLNQLFYKDAYGQIIRWNGTDEDTHLDLADYATVTPGADEQQYALITLRTLENEPAVYVSTPKSGFLDLDFTDIQECINQADPECIDSRVYRIVSDQTTLIASPVDNPDLRQWINVPSRLGNPTVITERLRVRANHQLIYYGEIQILGELQVIGEVLLLGEPPTGGGTVGMTSFDIAAGATTSPVTDGDELEVVDTGDIEWTLAGLMLSATLAASPTIADFTNMQHDHLDADDGGTLDAAAIGSGTLNDARLPASGVAAGTVRNAHVTFDAKGRATFAEDGANLKVSARLATAAVLPACTYANGASGVGATLTGNAVGVLTIDGQTVALNDRVLVKNQASGLQNGLYVCTTAGAGGVAFILTRDSDSDASAEILRTMVAVFEGTFGANSIWFCTNLSAITVGTTAITFLLGVPIDLPLRTVFDTTGQAALGIFTTASVANAFAIKAATTGNSPILSAEGSDTNRGMDLNTGNAGLGRLNGRWSVVNANYPAHMANTMSTAARNASSPVVGDLIFNSDTGKVEFWDGVIWRSVGKTSAILYDQKTSGTNGGTTSNATWNNRDLQTEQSDPYNIVTLSGNKMVPVAGDYEVNNWSAVVGGSASQTLARNRLFNVTTASEVIQGVDFLAAVNTGGLCLLACQFTANGTDEYRIDTYTTVGRVTNGGGAALGITGTEKYTTVILERI